MAQVAHALRTGEEMPDPSLEQEKAIVLEHYGMMLEHFGPRPGLRLARKHVSWYSAGLPASAAFRAAFNKVETPEEAVARIAEFYDQQMAVGAQREPRASRQELARQQEQAHAA